MSTRDYIEGKIGEFENQLICIAACRDKELIKPPHERDYQVLYMFHKDEALYAFCIKEFRILLNHI